MAVQTQAWLPMPVVPKRRTPVNMATLDDDVRRIDVMQYEVFDASRLRLVVARMGVIPSEAELMALMARIDSDNDGVISFSEFVDFVQQGNDDSSSLVGRLREELRDKTRFVNGHIQMNGAVQKKKNGHAVSTKPTVDYVPELYTPPKANGHASPLEVFVEDDEESLAELERRRLDSTALLSEFNELSRVQHEARVVVGGVKPQYTSSSRTGYDARDWSRVLLTWPSSFVVRRIRSPLIAISFWSLVVACLHQLLLVSSSSPWVTTILGQLGAVAPGIGIARTMTLAGSALSLLLVFRTNTAYNRYAEGRKVWEGIVGATRDCAEFCAAYVPEIGEARVRRIADLLVAFPLCLILYLQGQRIPYEPRDSLQKAFNNVVLFAGEQQPQVMTTPKRENRWSLLPFQRRRRRRPSQRAMSGKKKKNRPPPVRRHSDFFSWGDEQHAEDIPKSLVDNAQQKAAWRLPNNDVGPRIPISTFVAYCREDEGLAACFSLPSDVEPDVALAQLHQLKFGRKRHPNSPVTLSELEAYYNPLALARLLGPEQRARLARSRCPPLEIARQLTREAKAVPFDEEKFTSRERMALISLVGKIRHAVASAERIAQTPVPLHYARHALRFLSLWSLALPLALVNQLGFLTVPATAFIVWALFGLREIGTLIENPFSRPLQLQIVSDTLMIDVREAVDSMDLQRSQV